ncbi:hypothetical protein EIB18_03290 [Caulobacter vibrioides]|nr:hypothetical protein EIB18_03290 [Caulobacter vibrioides]
MSGFLDLRLGFIPLTDCAPLAVAKTMGFFAEEGWRSSCRAKSPGPPSATRSRWGLWTARTCWRRWPWPPPGRARPTSLRRWR